MRTYKYTGIFRSVDGHEYTLSVTTNGFRSAFFLLTADAIRMGRHHQLKQITDEKDNFVLVDDIMKVNNLLFN